MYKQSMHCQACEYAMKSVDFLPYVQLIVEICIFIPCVLSLLLFYFNVPKFANIVQKIHFYIDKQISKNVHNFCLKNLELPFWSRSKFNSLSFKHVDTSYFWAAFFFP